MPLDEVAGAIPPQSPSCPTRHCHTPKSDFDITLPLVWRISATSGAYLDATSLMEVGEVVQASQRHGAGRAESRCRSAWLVHCTASVLPNW